MHSHQKHLSSLRIQHGQAMIEYAILLILFSVVFIGGAELSKTGLASYKTTDAAKTAISEYAEINQQRLNILNAEKQYLTTLAGYGCSVMYEITNDYDVSIGEDGAYTYGSNVSTGYSRADLGADERDFTCIQPDGKYGKIYQDYTKDLNSGATTDTFEKYFRDKKITYSYARFDNYVAYLDQVYLEDEDFLQTMTGLLDEANLLISVYDSHNSSLIPEYTPKILYSSDPVFPSQFIVNIDEDDNGIIEIAEYESFVLNIKENEATFKDADLVQTPNDDDLGSDSFWAPESTSQSLSKQYAIRMENLLRIRLQLIIEHIKLSKLPLNLVDEDGDGDVDTVLSDAKIKLGDHSAVTASADCKNGSYNYNLDDNDPATNDERYVYRVYKDAIGIEHVYQTGTDVYIFQPIAIDVESCEGSDENRGGQSRLSILVNGYSPPSTAISVTDPEGDFTDATSGFVEGLPKLNQAMYSSYTKVCINASKKYVSCDPAKATIDKTLLKPPGKICFEDGGANADTCTGQPEYTGFYRWGQGSSVSISVADEIANMFRPTFQLDCEYQPNPASNEVDGCKDLDTPPSKVRIHTRYRSVFEGFLTFGMSELTADDVANGATQLFYNPNNVQAGNCRNGGAIVGSYGSEIGPVGSNCRPTIKQHKDFRGCYEVDVETNQVSACN